jgi:hypothetical protein
MKANESAQADGGKALSLQFTSQWPATAELERHLHD